MDSQMLSPERLKIVANQKLGGSASVHPQRQVSKVTRPQEKQAVRTNLRYNKVIVLPTLCELMD